MLKELKMKELRITLQSGAVRSRLLLSAPTRM